MSEIRSQDGWEVREPFHCWLCRCVEPLAGNVGGPEELRPSKEMGIRYSGRVPADSSGMLQLHVSYMAQTSGPLQSFPKWIGELLF